MERKLRFEIIGLRRQIAQQTLRLRSQQAYLANSQRSERSALSRQRALYIQVQNLRRELGRANNRTTLNNVIRTLRSERIRDIDKSANLTRSLRRANNAVVAARAPFLKKKAGATIAKAVTGFIAKRRHRRRVRDFTRNPRRNPGRAGRPKAGVYRPSRR